MSGQNDQAGHCQNKAAKIGLPAQDCQDMTAKAKQTERKVRKGLPEQYN
jgi:hypothetical protein